MTKYNYATAGNTPWSGWLQLISVPPPYGRTTHPIEGPVFFMMKCVGKSQILLLKVQECLDFSILQTIYPDVAPNERVSQQLDGLDFSQLLSLPYDFLHLSSCMPLGFRGFLRTSGFSLPYKGGGSTDLTHHTKI